MQLGLEMGIMQLGQRWASCSQDQRWAPCSQDQRLESCSQDQRWESCSQDQRWESCSQDQRWESCSQDQRWASCSQDLKLASFFGRTKFLRTNKIFLKRGLFTKNDRRTKWFVQRNKKLSFLKTSKKRTLYKTIVFLLYAQFYLDKTF